jgi:hypothetical protein
MVFLALSHSTVWRERGAIRRKRRIDMDPTRRLGKIGLFLGSLWGGLYIFGRTWGSTRDERARYLPGDDLVENPHLMSDHATTISASPEEVWPWLVQMGWSRGGFYTYRWVDTLFFPANGPSADAILPQWQDIKVGDHIPDGAPETNCFYEVEILEPNKMMVLKSWTHLPPQVRDNERVSMLWTWGFYLDDLGNGETRLLFRMRGNLKPWWMLALFQLVIVPADFVMARSFCSGLKRRIEHSSTHGLHTLSQKRVQPGRDS